jgi:hypothetical protein
MVFLSAPKQIDRAPDWRLINLNWIHTNTLGTPTFLCILTVKGATHSQLKLSDFTVSSQT